MRWDRSPIQPVVLPIDQPRSVVLWLSAADPPLAFVNACERAAMNLIRSKDVESAISVLTDHKPDLVIHDSALDGTHTGASDYLMAHRRTETLAVVPYRSMSDGQVDVLGVVGPHSCEANFFLTMRATLRRERPSAMKDIGHANDFVLHGSQFKFCCVDRCTMIGKTDLCLLGPFFDISDAILDLESFARLVFGDIAMTRSAFVQHLSRTRRHIKAELSIDPIWNLPGLGYALANDRG